MTEVTISAVSLAAIDEDRLHEMLDLHGRAVRTVCARHYAPGIVDAWLADRTPEGFRRAESAGERFVLSHHADGTVVGFASWRAGELVGLYVDPAFHGNGIGSRLAEFCDRQASEEGTAIGRVSSTLNAVTFYERLGFCARCPGARTKRGVSIPHVEMVRGSSA